MSDSDGPGRAFEAERPHLRAVAYRMLGSTTEAEDAVQETWLRLQRTDAAAIENLRAWLTTVVARIALNMLRSRGTRAEQPLEHLPDPIVDPIDGTDPEHEALVADSVGLALLMVLVNGAPGTLTLRDGLPFSVGAVVVREGRIAEIDFLGDPTRLAALDLSRLPRP